MTARSSSQRNQTKATQVNVAISQATDQVTLEVGQILENTEIAEIVEIMSVSQAEL